jgi:hypothetical protein
MNAVKMQGFTRVNKVKARNLYNTGKTVYIQSCNFAPRGPWSNAMDMNLPADAARYCTTPNDPSLAFDTRVSNFEWYNCPDSQTGKYAAFYVLDEEPAK